MSIDLETLNVRAEYSYQRLYNSLDDNSEFPKCRYYNLNKIKDKFDYSPSPFIFSLNCRSLPSKIDEIGLFFKELCKCKIVLIALQEIWTFPEKYDLEIENYN